MNNLRKLKILTFVGFYVPGFKAGGALRSVSNITGLLSGNYDFKLVALNRDFESNKTFENVRVNQWYKYDNMDIFYTDLKLPFKKITEDVDFDFYYLNSFFSYNFSIKVILLRAFGILPRKPVLIAPRGELGEGALSFKPLKKRLFIYLSKLLRLHKKIVWHASTRSEADDIKKIFGKNSDVKIALDVPGFDLMNINLSGKSPKKKDFLRILFISVIHRGKNLKYAIDILNNVKGNYSFDFYGPVKDKKYMRVCEEFIKKNNMSSVRYMGTANHSDLPGIYNNYDLLFFPTVGENFGHVIYESLALGTPVLTSDKVLWDRLEEFGAGWNYDLKDKQKFINTIEKLITCEEEEYSLYRNKCRDYLNSFISREELINDYKKLFDTFNNY